jgi:rubrerythrin
MFNRKKPVEEKPKNYHVIKEPIQKDYLLYSAKCHICMCEFNHGWGMLFREDRTKTVCPICRTVIDTTKIPLPCNLTI